MKASPSKALKGYANPHDFVAHHRTPLSSSKTYSDQQPVYVLPASALSKVIERAAKAMYRAENATLWSDDSVSDRTKADWLSRARAAYESGGFTP